MPRPPMALQQVVQEHPPEGLGRGKYPAPAWLVLLVAGLTVILAVAIVVQRIVRARRERAMPSSLGASGNAGAAGSRGSGAKA